MPAAGFESTTTPARATGPPHPTHPTSAIVAASKLVSQETQPGFFRPFLLHPVTCSGSSTRRIEQRIATNTSSVHSTRLYASSSQIVRQRRVSLMADGCRASTLAACLADGRRSGSADWGRQQRRMVICFEAERRDWTGRVHGCFQCWVDGTKGTVIDAYLKTGTSRLRHLLLGLCLGVGGTTLASLSAWVGHCELGCDDDMEVRGEWKQVADGFSDVKMMRSRWWFAVPNRSATGHLSC